MNPSSHVTGYGDSLKLPWSHTDLVRSWVIISFIVSIIGIAYISMSMGYGTLVPQLFYFPILYTAYFYPDRGMYVACSCGVAYAFVATFFIVPELSAVAGVIVQVLLFAGIAGGSVLVLNKRDTRSPAQPEDEIKTVQAMIDTGETDRIEFKNQALWSAALSGEEILASDSAEIRKYRNNASKFIIARSIAGFLNSDGGDLIIGVQEDRMNNITRITGIGDDYHRLHGKDRNPDGYRRMIVDSVVRKYLPEVFDTVSRSVHISFPFLSGKTVCHIHIMPSDKPVFVTTGSEELFFIRVDASTRPITGKTLTGYILTRFASS